MFENYIKLINHNRYLKLNLKKFYKYSQLKALKINIKFSQEQNIKFQIICKFFLFKSLVLKNGYFLIQNNQTRKIIGCRFILKHSLMYKYLQFLIKIFFKQVEVQNNIFLTSFDTKKNYTLELTSNYFYYFQKLLVNPKYLNCLNSIQITIIFDFNLKTKYWDHIFYLNFFKLTFLPHNELLNVK